jgi:hypothetical protein
MSDPNRPPRANPDPPADRTPTTPAANQPPADATTPLSTPPPPTPNPETVDPDAPDVTPGPAEQAAAQPPPHPGYYPPPPPKRAVVGRVVRHRATQLVAVGLLGLVLGGGIVALAERDHHPRYGVGADRPGHSRFDERGERGDRGPDRVPGRGSDRMPGPGHDFER